MGGFSLWHWLVLGVVVMLVFGKGRFSDMMGDVAKGIKSFKKGMSEEDDHHVPPPPAPRIDAPRQTIEPEPGRVDERR